MWIIFKFYNIITKSANIDKWGGKTLIHKMWIKRSVFLTLPQLFPLKIINLKNVGNTDLSPRDLFLQ